TANPILVWDPVAGASKYELNIATMTMENGQLVCDVQQASQDIPATTTQTVWTPLGHGPAGPVPYPNAGVSVEKGDPALQANAHYCVSIRAVMGVPSTTGTAVYGDYTFVNDVFTYVPNPPATGPVDLFDSQGHVINYYVAPTGLGLAAANQT